MHTIISLKIGIKKDKKGYNFYHTFYLKIWIKTSSFQFYPRYLVSAYFTLLTKGQMKSECIYAFIDFPKYHQKKLIDFCLESLFKLGMLCTHLSRVSLGIIKTNCMYLVYKTFQGRNLSNFFGGILENR